VRATDRLMDLDPAYFIHPRERRMATVQKVKLSSEMRYLNERLKDGRAVLQAGFSMKRLGKPDPAFQPRVVHIDMQHVKDLDDIYQARGCLDAVVIFHVADGDRYILVDGFHRHEVYKNAREDAIPAYVIEGTVEEAVEYTAMANQHAILKRTNEDIKKQIDMLLAIPRWFDLSESVIGKHVGVSHSIVRKYRAAFCAECNVPFPTHYVASDGRKVIRPRNRVSPAIYKNRRGQYSATFNGRQIYLGTVQSEAHRNLETKIQMTIARRAKLEPTEFFDKWLPSFGIALTSSRLHGSIYAGIGITAHGYGRVVITARLDEPGAIYAAIGRLYALREILEKPGDRLVMVCVCYPDDGPEALVEVARRLGVELLTPEELVASIKGDEAGEADDA
jgi:hypothetical protein